MTTRGQSRAPTRAFGDKTTNVMTPASGSRPATPQAIAIRAVPSVCVGGAGRAGGGDDNRPGDATTPRRASSIWPSLSSATDEDSNETTDRQGVASVDLSPTPL